MLASLSNHPQRLALLVLMVDASAKLLGFWRKTFWRTTNDELECHFDIIKTQLDCDAIRGISRALKPYFTQLNQILGVACECLRSGLDWSSGLD